MSFEENEEIFEEISGEEDIMDSETEKEYLQNLVADAQDRLNELTEEEEEDVEGSGGYSSFGRTYYRSHSGTAWSNFYRVMLTTCPGSIVRYRAISSGLTLRRKGSTLWVYRGSYAGKKQIEVVSKKGHDTYRTTITINFK